MENNQTLNIGNKICNLRKERGMTQVELADKLFVSHQAISQWENASTLPDINSLLKICEIFDVTLDDLFDFKKEEKSNLDIPNDDVLRILAVRNGKVLKLVNTDENEKVEIKFEEVINGSVSSMFSLNCNDIFGNVSTSNHLDCNNIVGNVAVGNLIDCNNIEGNVASGNQIDCNNINGDVNCGMHIECESITGDVKIGSNGHLDCEHIDGNVIYEK